MYEGKYLEPIHLVGRLQAIRDSNVAIHTDKPVAFVCRRGRAAADIGRGVHNHHTSQVLVPVTTEVT
jgi:hypothetical protein